MQASIVEKLERLSTRAEEVGRLLSDPAVLAEPRRYRDLSREYAHLEPLVALYREYRELDAARRSAGEMLHDADPAMRDLGSEEIHRLDERIGEVEERLKLLLVPRDPYDDSNIYLEIRAGAGGDEAAIFAGDLFRMYSRYAERQGWQIETISASPGEHGGFREIVSRVVGDGAYSRLKFESGAHRVQRVPETEAQGRIHTSTCTVAVLPEPEEIDEVDVNTADLRVDTYRASGAGGQHVNKTDSAVRLTHIPSGIVVECQDERSQHKNRAKAIALLKARLLDSARTQQTSAQAAMRKSLVGTGDRSERIRTYNYPQGRLTDHRINLTLYRLEEILAGNLDAVIEPLSQEHQAARLAELEHQESST